MAKKITMSFDSSMTIEEGIELFVKRCRIKNLTENTIKSYKSKLKFVAEMLGGMDLDISEITQSRIEDFILLMQDRGDRGTTINTYLRAIRTFVNYLSQAGHIKPFPVPLIKTEKKIKETYTEEELRVLLKKPDMKTASFTEYKTWVLENYLLATGNRIGTVLEIKIGDIDLDGGSIVLKKTKNRQQQIIPISERLDTILREYLKYRGGDADDYLFCNSFGGKACRRVMQQQVADYNVKRGVKKTSCHLFRHTYAKMYILNGGNVFSLQKLMGHSDLSVTKEYVNMFSNDLARDYNAVNPLDSLVAEKGKKLKLVV